jgi:hypothetical protein
MAIWLHRECLFANLMKTLKRVCDFEMPIGKSDLLTGIVDCGLFVSPLAARFWARIVD